MNFSLLARAFQSRSRSFEYRGMLNETKRNEHSVSPFARVPSKPHHYHSLDFTAPENNQIRLHPPVLRTRIEVDLPYVVKERLWISKLSSWEDSELIEDGLVVEEEVWSVGSDVGLGHELGEGVEEGGEDLCEGRSGR